MTTLAIDPELLAGTDDATDGAAVVGVHESHEGPAAFRVVDGALVLRTDGVVRVLRVGDLEWAETEGNYLRLHVGQHAHLVRGSASQLESELDPRRFARIHRRYVVAIDRVHEIRPLPSGDAVVLLRSGARVRLSRSYRDRFLSRFLRDAN